MTREQVYKIRCEMARRIISQLQTAGASQVTLRSVAGHYCVRFSDVGRINA
jgi:hypothetical protein